MFKLTLQIHSFSQRPQVMVGIGGNERNQRGSSSSAARAGLLASFIFTGGQTSENVFKPTHLFSGLAYVWQCTDCQIFLLFSKLVYWRLKYQMYFSSMSGLKQRQWDSVTLASTQSVAFFYFFFPNDECNACVL